MSPEAAKTTQYCLDTSFIVRLFESFPRDTYEALWVKIEEAVQGKCHIICEVQQELKAKFVAEHDWCAKQGIPIMNIEDSVFAEAQGIVADFPGWIKVNTTEPYFADPFIVAHAKVHGCVIVTAEKAEPPDKKKKEIKIPDVCDSLSGIDYIAQKDGDIEIAPVNEFLKRLGIKA